MIDILAISRLESQLLQSMHEIATLKGQIETQQARIIELAQAANAARDEAEALRNLAAELRGSAKCYNVHHSKAERHGFSEPCKALTRIDAAMAKGKVNV